MATKPPTSNFLSWRFWTLLSCLQIWNRVIKPTKSKHLFIIVVEYVGIRFLGKLQECTRFANELRELGLLSAAGMSWEWGWFPKIGVPPVIIRF